MKYGCNTQGSGSRGQATTSLMPDGWRLVSADPDAGEVGLVRAVRPVITDWIEMKCGILPQAGMPPDPGCKGCENAPLEWIGQ